MKSLLLASAVVLSAAGCSVVSHYAGAYGDKTEKGQLITGTSFTYTVPLALLRVHVDADGMIAYEDYGPGLGRGRVFVVRRGPPEQKNSLLDDLGQFGQSPAQVLRDGRLVSSCYGEWKGTMVQLHLIEVPEISHGYFGESMRIIDRERLWVLGMIVPFAEQRYWVSLTSSDSFFRESEGIGGWNLQKLFEFAEGLRLEANNPPEPTS